MGRAGRDASRRPSASSADDVMTPLPSRSSIARVALLLLPDATASRVAPGRAVPGHRPPVPHRPRCARRREPPRATTAAARPRRREAGGGELGADEALDPVEVSGALRGIATLGSKHRTLFRDCDRYVTAATVGAYIVKHVRRIPARSASLFESLDQGFQLRSKRLRDTSAFHWVKVSMGSRSGISAIN
jgi:hypothetical protein